MNWIALLLAILQIILRALEQIPRAQLHAFLEEEMKRAQ